MQLIDGTASSAADARWVTSFEDRYGEGSYTRLLAQLLKPCVTFADIAVQFGVTRENVRQWHHRLLPDAPSGHERQRLCRIYQQKRRLLSDGLLAGFYRRIRVEIPAQRVGLIQSRGGFLKRFLHIDGRLVALKRARPAGEDDATYVLGRSARRADFIYYELSSTDYLFVPRQLIPRGSTTFRDTPRSKYSRFKNTFAALLPCDRQQVAS